MKKEDLKYLIKNYINRYNDMGGGVEMEKWINGALSIGLLIGLICGYFFGQIHAWSQCADLCESWGLKNEKTTLLQMPSLWRRIKN